ncbi:hypothetical protein, partial [uncultured Dubosiella sp.]
MSLVWRTRQTGAIVFRSFSKIKKNSFRKPAKNASISFVSKNARILLLFPGIYELAHLTEPFY